MRMSRRSLLSLCFIVLALGAMPRDMDRRVPHGLVAGLTFNRANAYDVAGNTWTPVASPTFSSGVMTLNGSTQYIQTPSAAKFSFTDGSGTDRPFSISVWAKMDTTTTFRMVQKGVTISSAEYIFTTNPSSLLGLFVYSGGATTVNIGKLSTASMAGFAGAWTHFAATYSGNEETTGINLYVNGAAVATSNSTAGTYAGMSATASDLTVGLFLRDSGSPSFADGQIDDVRIYNRELTATEITQLFQSTINETRP